jgi:pyrimidine deaminase RibD-like protein
VKYLEVAELAATEEGPVANNVVVGVCVLAGIAAADAVCLMTVGERYAGQDHAEAAAFLARIDRTLGKELAALVRLKPLAHYGTGFVADDDRTRALRAAHTLTDVAGQRAHR